MRSIRTQVAIVGAGPAGLVLGHLLARGGIDAVVIEDRSREYVEHRQRAGVLEHDVVRLLRAVGLGARLDREGLEHAGIHLQFEGQRHHVDFRARAGRTLTIYAQTEVVKDIVADRIGRSLPLEFDVTEVALHDLATDSPRVTYRACNGDQVEIRSDVVAGCDGFHGPCRSYVPHLTTWERAYPYAWLGILADVAPSSDELIYARHPDGFALHSLRSRTVSRFYVQVPPDEDLDAWPDRRVWDALRVRLGLDGWTLHEGEVRDKSITGMRSFVAAPMRVGRLFLAGDAAHIVPPTGAKGLNLAIADVVVLANALVAWLRDADARLADEYATTCLDRVWRCTQFSTWMTAMLHTGDDAFDAQLQLAQLRQVVSSEAAATELARRYTGIPLPELV